MLYFTIKQVVGLCIKNENIQKIKASYTIMLKKEATNASKKAGYNYNYGDVSFGSSLFSLLYYLYFGYGHLVFAVKKEDDTMLDDWVGTGAVSISLWLFFTRPIQIFIQSNIKYVKEKKNDVNRKEKDRRKRWLERMIVVVMVKQ